MARRITAVVELLITLETDSDIIYAEDIVEGISFGVTSSEEDVDVEDVQITNITIHEDYKEGDEDSDDLTRDDDEASSSDYD